jgi:site-specific recombinase XerD
MTPSITSSAPEFSISGTSSIDDAEEIALYEQYLSISHPRQSNPSPEMRKKMFDDLAQMQQRALPRSRSEVNTVPTEQSQQQQQQKQEQQQQQQTTTSQIKPVGKFFSFLHMTFCQIMAVNLLDYVIVSLLMSKH